MVKQMNAKRRKELKTLKLDKSKMLETRIVEEKEDADRTD
jgi:hypothetical protein